MECDPHVHCIKHMSENQPATHKYLPPSIPEEIYATITRYRSYGWKWQVIKDVVNYYYYKSYTVSQLRQLYEKESAPSGPESGRGARKERR